MHRLCLVFALVAACGGSASGLATTSAALSADHRTELYAADAAHTAAIAQLGPVDGLVSAMRGNAVYLAAGIDILRGRHDIRETVAAENPDPEHTTLARTLAGGDVSADGNFGFTFGWITRTAPGGATSYGTYVATWEREDGEDFRVTAYYTRSSPFPHIPPRTGFPLFLDGAGAGGVPHEGSMAEQRRSVAEADTAFAALSVEQGYSIAFPAYAADFMMAFGRNFVGLVGNAEITAAYAGWTPAETLDWAPAYSSASASGDLGWTVGNAVSSAVDAQGVVHRSYSKYLTLWARNASGDWRFIADGGSPSPAPAL